METTDAQKWNERHFQICLALISRPTLDTFGYTRPVALQDVVSKADRLVNLLKEREAKLGSNTENPTQK